VWTYIRVQCIEWLLLCLYTMSGRGKGRKETLKSQDSSDSIEPPGTGDGVNNILLLDIRSEFRDYFKEITEELRFIKEDLGNKVKELINSVDTLKKENAEKDRLIEALSRQVNDIDQYSRNRNIEVVNVEEVPEEVVEDLIIKLADTLGVPLVSADIEAAHRLPVRNRGTIPRIIVQLASRKKRDQLLLKKKTVVTSNFLTGASGHTGEKRVFINENLNFFYKDLLWRAKEKAKETGFKFVWTRRGKIFARKDEISAVIRVNSHADLDKLEG
jgi:hypothetical protein